jgi:hypothetical protein
MKVNKKNRVRVQVKDILEEGKARHLTGLQPW